MAMRPTKEKEQLLPFTREQFDLLKARYEAAGYRVVTRWRPGLKHIRLGDIILTPKPTNPRPTWKDEKGEIMYTELPENDLVFRNLGDANEPQPATVEDEAGYCEICQGICDRQTAIDGHAAQPTTPHTAELPRLDFHIAEDLIQPPKPRQTACLLIEEDSGLVVAEFANSPRGIADCEEIIKRSNAHAALVEAVRQSALKLTAMTKADGSFETSGTEIRAIRDNLYAAFKLAEPDTALAGK